MVVFTSKAALYMQSMILDQIMIDAGEIIIPKFNFCHMRTSD